MAREESTVSSRASLKSKTYMAREESTEVVGPAKTYIREESTEVQSLKTYMAREESTEVVGQVSKTYMAREESTEVVGPVS